MITTRPYEPSDHAAIAAWWRARGEPEIQPALLPRGAVAEASGLLLAASFLYLDPGRIAVIEWTTTNPKFALSRDMVRAVKALYEHLERDALAAGCLAVLSFVAPASWERRTLGKMNYKPIGGEHVLLAKFGPEAPCP